jgi:hypothetical protein
MTATGHAPNAITRSEANCRDRCHSVGNCRGWSGPTCVEEIGPYFRFCAIPREGRPVGMPMPCSNETHGRASGAATPVSAFAARDATEYVRIFSVGSIGRRRWQWRP